MIHITSTYHIFSYWDIFIRGKNWMSWRTDPTTCSGLHWKFTRFLQINAAVDVQHSTI